MSDTASANTIHQTNPIHPVNPTPISSPTIVSHTHELIGHTPVYQLEHDFVPAGKSCYIKLEQFNPNLSIKDRTAWGLISQALADGRLKRDDVIIESTSGNLGKSLAMLGASLGIKVIVVVDPKISQTTLNWFKAYGAEVICVTEPDASGGYQSRRIEKVKELLSTLPNAYWPNQYDNPDNPSYHEANTACEFDALPFDMLVGCVSTGGHLSGIARGIKARHPGKKVLACDVVGSAVLGGQFRPYLLNGIGLAWRSDNTALEQFDETMKVPDQLAISMCHHIAASRGLLLGGSAGLVLFAGLVALQRREINSVVIVAPDTGINYLDSLYDHNWLQSKGVELLDKPALHHHITHFNPYDYD
ncbi:cysteine synthase family protein [Dickeya zeae]|uniref:cysteine synthase n=1 Tax=Dickeya zeae TaxID=204042 RepID=A0ABX8W0B0_9GAMM|nr:cysteine synthase family protein [Dickeya zeae]QYM93628.1 cysteine synthase family protein [Dickeya zeae]